MTETGITHVNRENHYRHNSVGQIVALAEQKVKRKNIYAHIRIICALFVIFMSPYMRGS